MKIICDGLDLSDAIRKVSKALPQKAINPVLEGIKITAKGRKEKRNIHLSKEKDNHFNIKFDNK